MEQLNELVSIIVPVYNAEKFLDICFESIIIQTYKNIEVIAVNDGSTDGSLNKLNKLSSIDNRIVVIDSSNHGVSNARNIGIKEARGHYLFFLDSDDWISKNCIELLVNQSKITKDTIIGTKFVFVSEKQEQRVETEWHPIKSYTNFEIISELFAGSAGGSACGKLYTHNRQKPLLFDTNLSHGEDLIFNIQNFKESGFGLKNIEEAIYYVFENTTSASRTMTKSSLASNVSKFEILGKYDSMNKYCSNIQEYLYKMIWGIIKKILKDPNISIKEAEQLRFFLQNELMKLRYWSSGKLLKLYRFSNIISRIFLNPVCGKISFRVVKAFIIQKDGK